MVKEVADRFDEPMPDTHDGMLAGGAEPEVAAIDQELHAMFLGCDGIILRDLNDLEVVKVKFDAAGRSIVFAYFPSQGDRRFLSEAVEEIEDVIRNLPFDHDALDNAGPVTKKDKPDFAARSFVVHPPLKLDVLP
ncbi:MAG: hypothetical protein HBSIN02_22400 [Bacteroidia bacterium]|nr:MAG: hypothetical protein HBSIN02_22400 [Bacteroidia bacterium]